MHAEEFVCESAKMKPNNNDALLLQRDTPQLATCLYEDRTTQCFAAILQEQLQLQKHGGRSCELHRAGSDRDPFHDMTQHGQPPPHRARSITPQFTLKHLS